MSGEEEHVADLPEKVETEENKEEEDKHVFAVPKPKDAEKEEEAKLKAKYPNLRKGGGPTLLQKRLQKGTKFFDSGDYNMAKAKMNNPKKPLAAGEKFFLQESIGDAIPTPEDVPHRKPSLATSKLLS